MEARLRPLNELGRVGVANGRRRGDDPRLSVAFSHDGGRLFFVSAAWSTSGAVHVIDLATRKRRYLFDGNLLAVLPDDSLVATRSHLASPHGPRVFETGVYDLEGRLLRKLSDDPAAIRRMFKLTKLLGQP